MVVVVMVVVVAVVVSVFAAVNAIMLLPIMLPALLPLLWPLLLALVLMLLFRLHADTLMNMLLMGIATWRVVVSQTYTPNMVAMDPNHRKDLVPCIDFRAQKGFVYRFIEPCGVVKPN